MLKHITSREDWSEKNIGAKGFTLIELLVVVVILGILAAVVVFSVRGFSSDAEDNACDSELRTVRSAAETHYAQHGTYPASIAALVSADLLATADTAGTYTFDVGDETVTQSDCP